MIRYPVTVEEKCLYETASQHAYSVLATVVTGSDGARISAAEIAQALNDGERYKIALETIAKASHTWNQIVKIAADALREGAGKS